MQVEEDMGMLGQLNGGPNHRGGGGGKGSIGGSSNNRGGSGDRVADGPKQQQPTDPSKPAVPGAFAAVPMDVSTAAMRAGVLPPEALPIPAHHKLGLAKLVHALGGPLMDKPKTIQRSDWGRRYLTYQQVRQRGF